METAYTWKSSQFVYFLPVHFSNLYDQYISKVRKSVRRRVQTESQNWKMQVFLEMNIGWWVGEYFMMVI